MLDELTQDLEEADSAEGEKGEVATKHAATSEGEKPEELQQPASSEGSPTAKSESYKDRAQTIVVSSDDEQQRLRRRRLVRGLRPRKSSDEGDLDERGRPSKQ